MQCRTCSYPLWNLAARQCPECGAGFRPSDFDFTPGSVRFHCPNCAKAYYGTSEKGHLVPRSFTCVGCGHAVDMDDMSLSPAQGVTEAQTTPIELPWLQRRTRGVVSCFFRTCGWAMTRPADVGRCLPINAPVGSAWWFMLIVQVVAWTVQMGTFVILPLLLGGVGSVSIFAAGFVGVVLATAGVTALIGVPLWAVVADSILRWTGSRRGGLGLTHASICFGSGAHLAMAIPFLGWLLGPVWWLVSATMTVKEAQRVSTGRAAVAVLPFPMIAAVLVVGGYVALVSWGASVAVKAANAAAAAAMVQATDATRVAQITATLAAASAVASGEPVDLIGLLDKGRLQASDLISAGGVTSPDTWSIAGVPLSKIQILSVDELRLMRERIAKLDHPGGVSERRLGDCVFYAPDANEPAPWTLVMWPDPGANPVENAAWVITVAYPNGSIAPLTPATFDAAFRAENERRKGAGEKALRHPRDVR